MGIRNLGLSLLSMLALAAFTPAQAAIGVSGPLQGGQNTTVTYTNPDRAGEVVVVIIESDAKGVQRLHIQLDENGAGSEDWRVPGGTVVVYFSTDDAHLTEIVEPSSVEDALSDQDWSGP